MKSVLVFFAIVFASVVAFAVTIDGHTLSISDDEQAACLAEGGCLFVTKAQFQQALYKAYVAGQAKKCSPSI